ncbi:hypothetical protein A2U01_0029917, partial [Trifolium medium]|nr:hypothetical protein [Trifolium medium]
VWSTLELPPSSSERMVTIAFVVGKNWSFTGAAERRVS